jgi:glycosyltransferase involved in cell wall biosynthesis
MTERLVSIVIPTFNRAHLLPRALASIQAQDFDDYEIVLVDDGSTDATAELLAGIAEPRLRCICLAENRGTGFARHTGLAHCRGQLIAFLDSDDAWTAGMLSLQVSAFAQFPQIELTFGDYLNINQMTGESELGFAQNRLALQRMQVERLSEEMGLYRVLAGQAEAMLAGNFIATPTVMFRASILERTGSFSTTLSRAEDFEFWWRAALNGVQAAYFERPLMERYKDEFSVTSNAVHFVPRLCQALDVCEQTARQHGRTDLLPAMRQIRLRSWAGVVLEHARLGQRGLALRAYRRSLQYGFSSQAAVYLLAALAGKGALQAARRLRGTR